MAIWTSTNRACKTLWTSLYSMQQLVTNFDDSGALFMNDLTFYNELADADQLSDEAKIVADQLDNIFINGRGAKYEPGVDHAQAISGMIAILIDKTKQVQDLASQVDASYKFWGE